MRAFDRVCGERQVDRLCGAVLASTSMNFEIAQLTAGVKNEVAGIRFLHPVLFMNLVEISADPARATGFEQARRWMSHLGIDTFVYTTPNPVDPHDGQPHDQSERPMQRRRLTNQEVYDYKSTAGKVS